MTRIPDVEGSDLGPRDPDVHSIGDRVAAEAATRKLAEGYEDRAWGCMSSRHKFCREPCPVYQVTRNEQHTSYGFHATVAAMSQGLVDLEDAYEQYAFCTQCGACELRCPNTLFTGDFYRFRTRTVDLVKAVRTLAVESGATVEQGTTVATIEAMKMEASLTAPRAGTVARTAIGPVQQVEGGDLLVVLE